MRIEAKGKKSEKGINYIGFETREIVPGGRVVSVRVQFIFFFSVFPLVTSRLGGMQSEANGKKSEKKNLYQFRNSGNRPLRRTSDRSRPVYFVFFFFLIFRWLLHA